MDFLSARKTGATYGRPTKKTLVHDLFEYRSSSLNSADHNELGDRVQRNGNTISTTTTDRNGAHAQPVKHTLPSRSSPTPSADSSASNLSTAPNSANVFDLSSSEEESLRARSSDVNKRRKIAQPPRSNDGSHTVPSKNVLSRPRQKVNTTSASIKSQEIKNPKAIRKESVASKPVATVARTSSRNDTKARDQALAARQSRRKISSTQQSDVDSEWPTPVDELTTADTSGHLTDQSNASLSKTPNRKRPLSQYSEESVPSPSALGFTSLRLTPERRLLHKKATSPGFTSDEDETPRKVRSRLIDRLDAPCHNSMTPDTNGEASARADPPPNSQDANPIRQPSAIGDQTLVDASSTTEVQPPAARSRATYGTKARTTYAKERSHLSDMTEDMDLLSNPSSSNPSYQLSSQRTTSNLAMQLEIDDDEENNESSGPGRLKSIHELRKAGANNRFDREVLGLLEDIELEGASSRSLRLQALMKLIRRSEDSAFLGSILDTGRWIRLGQASSASSDPISTVLFSTVVLLLSDAASADTIPKLLESAEKLSPQLLESTLSLRDAASIHKLNLSKSLIRDLAAFNDYLNDRFKAKDYLKSRSMDLRLTALLTLERTLQRCLDLGAVVRQPSTDCYSGIVSALVQDASDLSSDQASEVVLERIKKALKLLEALPIAFREFDLDLPDSDYAKLGTAFAEVMEWSRIHDESFGQNALRAIVSLSNSKSQACHLLGQTRGIDTIFSTVDDHFQSVAVQADLEQALDHTKLDLVILSLGCLLNFAECDGDVRTKLAVAQRNGHNYIDRLVSIFNSQVAKVQEATTQEQSQVLVAVGYLSMVLCALSLDPTIKSQITQSLHKRSFVELCNTAETFLQHLRTVERLADEDGSPSAFTARFNAILETIRDSSS